MGLGWPFRKPLFSFSQQQFIRLKKYHYTSLEVFVANNLMLI